MATWPGLAAEEINWVPGIRQKLVLSHIMYLLGMSAMVSRSVLHASKTPSLAFARLGYVNQERQERQLLWDLGHWVKMKSELKITF